MGLWNRLTRHQERTAPFRLTRIEVPVTREGMARLALMRREELDGFIEGLFGDRESLDFPERAHKALGVLAEIRAMFEGSRELAEDPSKPAAAADIAVTVGHFRELTKITEHEMHELAAPMRPWRPRSACPGSSGMERCGGCPARAAGRPAARERGRSKG